MISFNPKSRFQDMKELAASHRDLVVKNSFVMTLEIALLHYQQKLFLDASADPVVAAAQAQRLTGAQQFIDVLLNLGEKSEGLTKKEPAGVLYKTS